MIYSITRIGRLPYNTRDIISLELLLLVRNSSRAGPGQFIYFENGCVLYELQSNEFRYTYFPKNRGLQSLTIVVDFLLQIGVRVVVR